MRIFHIKMRISGSPWRMNRHNSTGPGPHMEQSNSSFHHWKKHVLLSPDPSLPFPWCINIGAWQLPSIVHSFPSPLWSLSSMFTFFAAESIKFYSWVNSDHQRAAVLDHTMMAHCRIPFTKSYTGIMSSLGTFAAINCLYAFNNRHYYHIFLVFLLYRM